MENSNKVGAWVVEREIERRGSPLTLRIPHQENSEALESVARESWISHETRPTITGNENVIYPNNSRISDAS